MFLNWNGKSRMFKSIFCFLALSFSLLGFSSDHTTAERRAYPLHEAVSRLNLVEVERLLATLGYSVDDVDDHGNTPLLYAAMEDSADTIKYLVAEGANIDFTNENGNKALHFAAMQGSADIIQYLVAEGADINFTDKNGNTALHFAVMCKSPAAIESLLSLGANYDARNEKGLKAEQLITINHRIDGELVKECLSIIEKRR